MYLVVTTDRGRLHPSDKDSGVEVTEGWRGGIEGYLVYGAKDERSETSR